MPEIATCGECGAALPLNAPQGLCPRCLIRVQLHNPDQGRPFTKPSLTNSPGTVARPKDQAPDCIEHYTILKKIGEGGCGVVYMAEQHQPVQRRVAIKVIKLGMDTKEVVARFAAEQQALALMDHPNIAKVLDAGATDTGRPFFVMELVQGVKITEYCDNNNLSTSQRLELFTQVCRAIQHAHQKGLIHRDIKPSNILVTLQDGISVPKVIDFGIAKATQGRLTDHTVFTVFEQFIGTPAYMSPEQAELSALDIDTRSDIYSLGVLLYELLTGRTPFDTKELLAAGLDELRRTIREREPVRPSTCLSTLAKEELTDRAKHRQLEAPKLIGQLRGDLDWIVMKALEKDRARRYETATGLALDIQRHLHNEPVMARPPSKSYRFEKLVRRNKLAFAAAATVSVVLVVGAVVSAWQAIRATHAEQHAQDEANKALLAQRVAQERGETLRLLSYVSDMNLALRYCQESNFSQAWQLLQSYSVKPDETDLRGFEWRYLYRLCRGNYSRALPRHNQILGAMEYSPDGRRLATYCLDQRLRLWGLDQTAQGPIIEINNSSGLGGFSPGGDRLIFGGADGTVQIYDISKRERTNALTGVGDLVAFAAQANLVATFSPDCGLRIWDLANGKRKLSLPRVRRRYLENGWMNPAAIDSHGKRLAVVESDEFSEAQGKDLGIRLWDLETGDERSFLKDDRQVRLLRFSPSGDYLTAAHGDGTVAVWNLATAAPCRLIPAHEKPVSALAFSADESELATGSSDEIVKRWDVATGLEKENHLRGQIGVVSALAYSPSGQEFASGGRDTTIKIWSLHQREAEDMILDLHTKEFGNVTFSPDGKSIAAGCKDVTVKVWDLETLKPTAVLTGMQYVVAFTPDSKQLLASTSANVGYWWDLETQRGRLLPGYAGDIKRVTCVDLSPDGHVAALGLTDGSIQLLEVDSGKQVGRLSGHSGQVRSLKFSTDGNTLISGGTDRYFKVWDVKRLTPLGGKEEHKAAVCAVAISHDAKWLATGCGLGTLKLWNPANLTNSLVTIPCHKAVLRALNFSQDGQTLASGGEDKTVKLWSLALLRSASPQREVASFPVSDKVRLVEFSPDDKVLAVVTEDGILRLYKAVDLAEADEESKALRQ